MQQVAVFVDAGYLYAQGSVLVCGHKQQRHRVRLDIGAVLEALRLMAQRASPEARLLRVYWYDGLTRNGRLTSEQDALANSARTKLRLGLVNSQGEQKGVDSLIVTDLIDLARNRAITDALVVSGDEDIRIGVQIAQTFGVQVHLLGIRPARGNQSPDLIQEADTHLEWQDDDVRVFLAVDPPTEPALPDDPPTDRLAGADTPFPDHVDAAIRETFESLPGLTLDTALNAYRRSPGAVPRELDRPTLGRLANRVGRDLSDEERKAYRRQFRETLDKKAGPA